MKVSSRDRKEADEPLPRDGVREFPAAATSGGNREHNEEEKPLDLSMKGPRLEPNGGSGTGSTLATNTATGGSCSFVCSLCKKSFHTQNGLNYHTDSIHQGIRYRCQFPGCRKTFTRRYNVKRHMENSKIHNRHRGASKVTKPQLRMASNLAPGVAPNLAPNMAPNVAPGVAPNLAPNVAPGVASNLAPNVAPGVASNLAPGVAPNLAPGVAPNMASDQSATEPRHQPAPVVAPLMGWHPPQGGNHHVIEDDTSSEERRAMTMMMVMSHFRFDNSHQHHPCYYISP